MVDPEAGTDLDAVVASCQADRREACGTGRLSIEQLPETCSQLNEIRASTGTAVCPDMSQKELRTLCYETVYQQPWAEEATR